MPQVEERDQQTDETGDKQSRTEETTSTTTDLAASSRSGVSDHSADDDATDEAAAIELIPKEKYDQLKSDPVKLNKELVRAANKKFRDAADERKAFEPYSNFIAALQKDPRAAISALGTRLGMEFKSPKSEETAVEDLNTAIVKDVRAALGPEYEDLADRLAPAIRAVAERVAAEQVRPLQDGVSDIINDSAIRESKLAIDSFSVKHPDWKDHEPAMVALSKKVTPGEDVTEEEYLENLYYLVTRDKSTGDGVKKTIAKMQKSAGDGNSRQSSTVSDKNVSRRPTTLPTFTESAEAAKRGERFE